MRATFFEEEKTRESLAEFIRRAPRLSMGAECLRCEEEFCAFQKRKHTILVCNGSAANLALIQALLNLGRLRTGDRVGVSSLTWATNVMPLMQLGLVPVAIDCERHHLNVSLDTLTPHLRSIQALFLTNVLGLCGDIDKIAEACNEHHILLLEDNCESLGTVYKGKLLGNFGFASTCSFFVGHHLSTIEGGVVCTDDDELSDMVRMVRAHGWDRNLAPAKQQALRTKHHIDDFHAQYTFYVPAYNVRPTEITGFLCTQQLPKLTAMIERRETHVRAFVSALRSRPDLYEDLTIEHIERCSNFAMPVIAHSPAICQEAVHRFQSAGVEVRPVIAGNISTHPFWQTSLPKATCPNADLIHSNGFYFPNHPELTDEEIELLCSLLRNESC